MVLGPVSVWAPYLSYFNLNFTDLLCVRANTLDLLLYELLSPLVFYALLFLFFMLNKLPRVFCWDKRGSSIRSYELDQTMHNLTDKMHDLNVKLIDEVGQSTAEGPTFDRRDSSMSQVEDNWVPVPAPRNTASRTPDALAEQFIFYRALTFLMIFTYQSMTETTFHILTCKDVGPCGNRLSQFPEISCDDPDYLALRKVAFAVLGLYVIPFPIALGVWLWSLGDRRHDVIVKAKWGVMYERYREEAWWWQIQVPQHVYDSP